MGGGAIGGGRRKGGVVSEDYKFRAFVHARLLDLVRNLKIYWYTLLMPRGCLVCAVLGGVCSVCMSFEN